MSGARSAFHATARTLPCAIRGSVLIVSALLSGAAWLFTRGLPPAARLGSELLRRPVDWVLYLLLAIVSACAHVLMASLGFWRFAAAELAVARWLLALQAVTWGLAAWAGYGVLVAVAVWAWLAIGAAVGLAFEYRSFKAREAGGKGEPDGVARHGPWPPGLGPPGLGPPGLGPPGAAASARRRRRGDQGGGGHPVQGGAPGGKRPPGRGGGPAPQL